MECFQIDHTPKVPPPPSKVWPQGRHSSSIDPAVNANKLCPPDTLIIFTVWFMTQSLCLVCVCVLQTLCLRGLPVGEIHDKEIPPDLDVEIQIYFLIKHCATK